MKKKIICTFAALLLFFAGTLNAFAAVTFTSEKTIETAVKGAAAATKKDGQPIYVSVPVLMFHHLDTAKNAPLTPDSFRTYMEDLKKAGYETVFFDDLIAFVDGKGTLPEKPIVVTFDDGYTSNYTYAYPILKELGMKGAISVIGYSVGLDKDAGSGIPITPHFTWQQAKEMHDAGIMRIHSHTYHLHQNEWLGEVTRDGVLKNPGEPITVYRTLLEADTQKLNKLIADNLRYVNPVYTYPYGLNDPLTESILSNLGLQVTVTIDSGVNIVKAGDKASLKLLKRISCDKNDLDIVKLIEEQSLL